MSRTGGPRASRQQLRPLCQHPPARQLSHQILTGVPKAPWVSVISQSNGFCKSRNGASGPALSFGHMTTDGTWSLPSTHPAVAGGSLGIGGRTGCTDCDQEGAVLPPWASRGARRCPGRPRCNNRSTAGAAWCVGSTAAEARRERRGARHREYSMCCCVYDQACWAGHPGSEAKGFCLGQKAVRRLGSSPG